MNKLIDFFHNPESKTLHLGNEGFLASRYNSGEIAIWYRGCMLCRFTPDGLQWIVQTYPLSTSAIDYFGIVTAEELKTAILDCDTEEATRLMEVIKQAMKEYI